MTPSGISAQLRGRWNTLNPRERSLIAGAVLVLALATIWWIGLAPALKTLAQADARQRSLDAPVPADAGAGRGGPGAAVTAQGAL
jgi:type II secretory pathway component PulM